VSNKTSLYKNYDDAVEVKVIGALKKTYIKVLYDNQVLHLKWDETQDRYQCTFFGDVYYCDYNVETNIEDAIHIGDFGTAEQDIEITNAKRSTSGRPTGSVFYTKR